MNCLLLWVVVGMPATAWYPFGRQTIPLPITDTEAPRVKVVGRQYRSQSSGIKLPIKASHAHVLIIIVLSKCLWTMMI